MRIMGQGAMHKHYEKKQKLEQSLVLSNKTLFTALWWGEKIQTYSKQQVKSRELPEPKQIMIN